MNKKQVFMKLIKWLLEKIRKKPKKQEPIICGGMASPKKKKTKPKKKIIITSSPIETKGEFYKRLGFSYSKAEDRATIIDDKTPYKIYPPTQKEYLPEMNPLAISYFKEILRTGKVTLKKNQYIGKIRGYDALLFLRHEFLKKHVKTERRKNSIVAI